MGAHTCNDYDVGLGGVDAGDFVIVHEGTAATLPAGIVMTTGHAASANTVHLRFCNVLSTTSSADASIPIRWYAFTP